MLPTVTRMKLNLRSGLVAVLAAATLGTALPTAAYAAPSTPARSATAKALPAYDRWIADVTAVADDASEYLDSRLPDSSMRAAIVLDIDNTSLQTTYRPGVTSPATPPILALARQAIADGAAVFFVTARPQ